MYNIRIHCIVFESCVTEKEEVEERKKLNKIDILLLAFSTLRKINRTYRVDLATE